MADLYIKFASGLADTAKELCDGVIADYNESGELIGLDVTNAERITLDTNAVIHVTFSDDDDDDDVPGHSGHYPPNV